MTRSASFSARPLPCQQPGSRLRFLARHRWPIRRLRPSDPPFGDKRRSKQLAKAAARTVRQIPWKLATGDRDKCQRSSKEAVFNRSMVRSGHQTRPQTAMLKRGPTGRFRQRKNASNCRISRGKGNLRRRTGSLAWETRGSLPIRPRFAADWDGGWVPFRGRKHRGDGSISLVPLLNGFRLAVLFSN